MGEGRIGGVDYFRAAELLISILGLTFSILSDYVPTLLVIGHVLAMLYMIIMIICLLANKLTLTTTVQAVIEVILAIFLVIFTIMTISRPGSKDVWCILAIVTGFILPCLFMITAYDKF